LFLIFKEAVNNIVKHSNATHVTVKMTKEVNKLKLTIKDNGTKISASSDNLNGHGIENMKLRAKKMNGAILINTQNGFTLEVWFHFSVRKNYINM
jgi:signal transduction histidine kinase